MVKNMINGESADANGLGTAGLRGLRNPVVIAAFEGWNDAADAATEVIEHLTQQYATDLLFELDPEDYFDFQETRPRVQLGFEGKELVWPTISVSVCHFPNRDAVLLSGPEPNLKWRSFTANVISALRSVKPEMVILLGAMLTDSPHTRPLPVSASSNDAGLARALGLSPSNYEGPTGIVGVLNEACVRAGFTTISLWASVPHYVAAPPNPKATLALLQRIEDVLDESLSLGDLPELTNAWERGVNELTADDPDITEYVEALEEKTDASDLPEEIGEAIANEFERYLRRRGPGGAAQS